MALFAVLGVHTVQIAADLKIYNSGRKVRTELPPVNPWRYHQFIQI